MRKPIPIFSLILIIGFFSSCDREIGGGDYLPKELLESYLYNAPSKSGSRSIDEAIEETDTTALPGVSTLPDSIEISPSQPVSREE